METVADTPASENTILQSFLFSCAVDVVHESLTASLTKVCKLPCISCSTEAELFAHNVSVCDVPVIITHSAPLTTIVDFNPAFRGDVSINEPHIDIWV